LFNYTLTQDALALMLLPLKLILLPLKLILF
jgi:hypothetical protein